MGAEPGVRGAGALSVRRALLVCLVVALGPSGAGAGAHTTPAMLVELARPPDAATAHELRAAGAALVERDLRIWRLPGPATALLPRLAVRRLEPDRVLRPLAAGAPATVAPASEWWLRAIGAGKLDAPGPGKPVTVVDTGIDAGHPEFAGHDIQLLNRQDGIDLPGDYHGTAVSSLVSATGVRVVGVYPRAVLREWDATRDGQLSLSAIIEGVDAAIRAGPGVINLSLGGPIDDRMLRDAILDAAHEGSLVVAAQGEDRFDGSPPAYPADDPKVLAVVATDRHNAVYIDSNGSESNDLSAPGVGVDVAVPASASPSGYRTVTGNSFAAPIVSAAAAWIWTRRPSLTPAQLYGLLVGTARRISNGPYNTVSGYGLLNLRAGLTAPVPPASPFEPNDDIAMVEPGRLFSSGEPLLTSPVRRRAFVRGGLYQNENPRDVYRVWIPARGRVSATATPLTGQIQLRAWRPGTRTVLEGGADRLRDTLAAAAPGDDRLELSNPTGHGMVAYVEVSIGSSQTASYSLALR